MSSAGTAVPCLDQRVTLELLSEPEPAQVPGTLEDCDETGLVRVAVGKEIPEWSRVRISAGEDYVVCGIVVEALAGENRHVLGIRVETDERRSEARVPVQVRGELSVIRPTTGRQLEVLITDMSKSGLGFQTSEKLVPGYLVKISTEEALVFGEIRHCAPHGKKADKYKAGVLVHTVLFRKGESGYL